MPADCVSKFFELTLVRKFAIDQQVRYLDKIAIRCKFLDCVTTITKHPLFAVEERNTTTSRTGVYITLVDRDQASLLSQLANIDRAFLFGTFNDGKL